MRVEKPYHQALKAFSELNQLSYKGPITDEFLTPLWIVSEEVFFKNASSKKAKKQQHILIELSQNINQHSINKQGEIDIEFNEKKQATICCFNKISNDQIVELKHHLQELSQASQIGLTKLYIKGLSKKMTKKTAGLGLIQVFKYAEKIQYDFIEKNGQYFYLLKAIL